MKIKALISFSGILSMCEGEVMEYNDKVILQDLLKSGYIEEVKEEKTTKKVVKKNESK